MSVTEEDARELQECLAGDGVAVIPTDTVYGLACNPNSVAAVRRIHELKQRAPEKPSAVMFFALEAAIGSLAEIGPRTLAVLGRLLPGPVTLLLANASGSFPLASSRPGALLGLRVPRLDGSLTALRSVTAAAMQSSANLSGDPPPRQLGEVPASLREGADLALDAGELPGVASTVIDLSDYEQSGAWRVVREGPLGLDALSGMLDC